MATPPKTNLENSLVAFRIADKRHPLFDGRGAMIYGGRWNSQGNPVIYASLSYAGCLLEVLANVGRMGEIPETHQSIKIYIPVDLKIEEVNAPELSGWSKPDRYESQKYGDAWLRESRSVALIVPSVLGEEERNILINPDHRDFSKISTSSPKDVVWDQRLFFGLSQKTI